MGQEPFLVRCQMTLAAVERSTVVAVEESSTRQEESVDWIEQLESFYFLHYFEKADQDFHSFAEEMTPCWHLNTFVRMHLGRYLESSQDQQHFAHH